MHVKSHVSKALYQAALTYYNGKDGDNFAELKVLMLAHQLEKQHIILKEILFTVL